MTQGKTITLLGEEVTIAFNMAVEIEYEELSDTAFDISAFVSGKTKAALQLAAAAVTANNPQSSITYDRIIHEITPDEVKTLVDTVVGEMMKWLKIPAVVAQEIADDSPAGSDDEQPAP